MGDRERNKKRLLELLQAAGTGNAHCADCGAADPDWASYKLGIFICLNCSGVHRNFPDISKIKSVRLDFWDDSTVEFMTHNGNLRGKAKYEARVPAFYYVPQANDCLVLKEQWIRAKYERQEFMADGKSISLPGTREGFLWKRGRDNAQFLRRKFVLLSKEGLLKYYTKEEEIVDWFNALRAARLQYLKTAFPEFPESEEQSAFCGQGNGDPENFIMVILRLVGHPSTSLSSCPSSPGSTSNKASWKRLVQSRENLSKKGGLPWIPRSGGCSITRTHWMPLNRARFFLGATSRGTESMRTCPRVSEGTAGKPASRLSPLSGDSSSPAPARRSSGNGWRVFRMSSPAP
ncbi:arf-GAP with dual PH domain-containing protein 2 isoform X3 [Eumetopias jubatus]|uniref:arf-GAP with dual PH domain-containing protein 2 isoform X3 n=1 Tax=Eumetopias jubatus TaxID=34886 RepID=UPI00101706BF|nr:arf-GAP with dual PH domain-containing protein 2 isoform X3 [Eumetopias jubatus]